MKRSRKVKKIMRFQDDRIDQMKNELVVLRRNALVQEDNVKEAYLRLHMDQMFFDRKRKEINSLLKDITTEKNKESCDKIEQILKDISKNFVSTRSRFYQSD
jgi:hypothetical protein